LRVGDTVLGGITFNIDPTAAGATTTLYFDLPIASNLGGFSDLVGTCSANGSVSGELSGAIYADETNNRARVDFIAGSGAGNHTRHGTYMYRVI
jgi:hypothetical protein